MINNHKHILLGGDDSIVEQPVSTDIQPNVDITPVVESTTQTNNIENKYVNIVATINKKYNEFKKSLYDYVKTQNLTENELYILIPSNDEPYISDSKIDKMIFQNISTNIVFVGKNDHVTNAQIPFYNSKIIINT